MKVEREESSRQQDTFEEGGEKSKNVRRNEEADHIMEEIVGAVIADQGGPSPSNVLVSALLQWPGLSLHLFLSRLPSLIYLTPVSGRNVTILIECIRLLPHLLCLRAVGTEAGSTGPLIIKVVVDLESKSDVTLVTNKSRRRMRTSRRRSPLLFHHPPP